MFGKRKAIAKVDNNSVKSNDLQELLGRHIDSKFASEIRVKITHPLE